MTGKHQWQKDVDYYNDYCARRDGRAPTVPNEEHFAPRAGDANDAIVARMRNQRGAAQPNSAVAQPAPSMDHDGHFTPRVDFSDAVVARIRQQRNSATSDLGDVPAGELTDRVVLGLLERRVATATGPEKEALQNRLTALRSPQAGNDHGESILARFDASDQFLVGPRLGSQLREAQATAEQRAKFAEFRRAEVARRERAREDGSPIALTVVGDQARVSVHGLLTAAPDLWAWMLGEPNTLYSDIADAIVAAEQNPSVRHVIFDIESGGGSVSGLRTATRAVRSMKKPRSAVSSFAASAAYWIAAEIGRIEAKHDLAEFGSIGVAVRSVKHPIVHDIASTNAPNKRPDPSTAEGQAAIRQELDQIHAVFAADVAAGRSRALGRTITVEQVNSTFGSGGMLLATEALRRGLIDGIRA